MPFAVYLLGLAVFAQSTSEFMLSGLVPDIAADLGVSIADAGYLTSAFAIGMIVGAPLLAILARRWSQRRAVTAFLVVFAAAHVLGALTASYAVLLGTRIVAAVANAGFWALATTVAVGLVATDAKGRAMSVLMGGVTLACVAGVPGGAVLGQAWGWRSAFWAVAALAVAATLAVVRTIPVSKPDTTATAVRPLLRCPLLLTYATNALVQGATFASFTYLAPLVTEVTGLPGAWVPGSLVLFGTGACAGIVFGGRVADARPRTVLLAGTTALAVGWAVLAVCASSAVVTLVLVFVQGMLAFGLAPALTSRVFYQAPGNALAGGFTTAAFNVGNTLGPALGGLAIEAGFGFRSPAVVSALLMIVSVAQVHAQVRPARREIGA
ncbi:Cmx/CmrA family chloramphenicol efflux MFS transporter [Amycolatopsis granulosa]|uniref:Cmx/CmrA family chloramphenicol efflux MFS transporter n=1 Tax=Amycolatopsis granulosa TaxID=185684 RepID=UPI00141EE8C7|nr:Cmx/CmrA family chloramphenicol efflux MFS transporter [Amycolatopsis granulosa]NIH86639.1 DHA1 family chloramphenicol resistance protein-like MFS transporter [Amycolatopsis granulosa]